MTTKTTPREPLTPSQVKRQMWAKNTTLKQWAETHGYPYNTVSAVMTGKIKCKQNYGRGYEIATKLGLIVESADGEITRAKVAA